MNKIKSYKILWWTIPIIFLPIALGTDGALNLQLHDTYFVVASLHVAIVFALALCFFGVIYWLLRSYKLNSILSAIHSIGTSLCLIGIALIMIFHNTYRTMSFDFFRLMNTIEAVIILILIAVQILFLVNIIIGLTKGIKE